MVVAKLQTGFDEKKLHTLFLDKEIRGISAIQTISRVNRTAKYKNDCKIVDFSYNNVNVQNIKDAFEHFSDVVVSDFDPFGDKKVLDILLAELNKSDTYDKFFNVFMGIYRDPVKRDQPESYLDFESSLKKYIEANPQRTADTKAKAAQYFTILNRIEFVIALDAKYSEPSFLFFWRKFNTLYNMLHRSDDVKDPIEVYFDNQIGMVEVIAEEPKKKKKKPTEVATGAPPGPGGQYDILAIIAARNDQEEKIGSLILEFESKISDFFNYVNSSTEGERLIVKIKSHVSENEIYDDFSKIYRKYRALYRSKVGDYFFKETEDLVDKLCDDFELMLKEQD
ncbi:type I restriction enzyme subunit R domain-containing protein [Providencia huaxiensis]|uniref:type I restriction enzyme subunit R domain-containing protein n=1 Tax=Providencia huaxiensis TaxID=2027290 RepID=UPI003D817FD6